MKGSLHGHSFLRSFAALVAGFYTMTNLAPCATVEEDLSVEVVAVPPFTGIPAGFRIVGYAPDWTGLERLSGTIDWELYTHINVAFANPDASGGFPGIAGEAALIAAAHEAGVKVLVSLGGGETYSDSSLRALWFREMAVERRAAFVERLVAYAVESGYDGVDVDLEGPAIGPDYPAFIALLRERLSAVRTGAGEVPLLTAALGAWKMAEYLDAQTLAAFDWINVMAYDFRGPWDASNPGQHAPYEYALKGLELYREAGVPADHLVLGLPLYGYAFGGGAPGYLAYKTIAAASPWAKERDDIPYGRRGRRVWYNGRATIRDKVLLAQGAASGVMFWQIGDDAAGEESLVRFAASVAGAAATGD